jgi:putative Holliday junction resolvase
MTASAAIQQFLAFDWGKLRVGVASGNTLTKSAQSVATLVQQGVARDQAILKLVKEWRPHALVVGVPYHPDGAPHKNTKLAKQFAQNLRGLTGALVHEVDERYSTTEAKADNPRAREAKLDAFSACIILEQYMRSLPE